MKIVFMFALFVLSRFSLGYQNSLIRNSNTLRSFNTASGSMGKYAKHKLGYGYTKPLYSTDTEVLESNPSSNFDKPAMKKKLDKDFAKVALPAFVSLAADPLASMVDAIYVARLGAVQQAAMGIAVSAQFSIAKLYNDPLLKTSTSLVAGIEGEELEKSVATIIATAMAIGIIQCVIFLAAGTPIIRGIGVSKTSEMLIPAVNYLKWRAFGVPAATVLLVSNGIFRGKWIG
mmetsp:Transcript_326/g.446  ORF Transcript_326/g.446 Transcript_326/m.446 type:complete len:231 (+) Transcript_326:178-870(+)